MAKQNFSNRKWAPLAWDDLKKWVFSDPVKAQLRMRTLTTFNKDNHEFHHIVAKCLFKMARQANLPWGRSGSQPNGYSKIPITEKVKLNGILIRLGSLFCCCCCCLFFFFSLPIVQIIYEHSLVYTLSCSHLCVTRHGLSLSVCV